MATLTQPTGTQITAIVKVGDSLAQVGGWDATSIDALIAALPTANPITMAYNEAVILLMGAGYDYQNLTNVEHGHAFAALIYKCIADLLGNWKSITTYVPNEQGRDGLTEHTRKQMRDFINKSVVQWSELGISPSWNPYDLTGTYDIATINQINDEI